MSFELYYHPLSSYCWKALIALYEAEIRFEKCFVDLSDPTDRAALLKLAPLGKFPVLVDTQRARHLPESSILIEYLAQHAPSAARLVPSSRELALKVRAADRFFDLYVMEPMGKIVEDRLRPGGERDPRGVANAHLLLDRAYAITEGFLQNSGWAVGADFSLADCAAAPALFYADKVHALTPASPRTRAYCERLSARPSFARVLREAQPFMSMFPG